MSLQTTLTTDAVIREHRTFIRRTLSLLRVEAAALDDAAQEVFRAIHRRLSSLDLSRAPRPAAALRSWLYGTCACIASNHHRAAARRLELLCPTEELDAFAAPTPPPEQALDTARRRALLDLLLARLPAERRVVVVLHLLEGVPMREIAAAQAISLNTAWNRLRLARDQLRADASRGARRGRREGRQHGSPRTARCLAR